LERAAQLIESAGSAWRRTGRRNERQRIDERTVRALRPALAAALTPSQMDRAGLSGADRPATGHLDR
jgi:hypothetical protein